MAKLRLIGRDKKEVTFTQIPNEVIRSQRLDAFDKVVFACLCSCYPSYPSYTKLMEWSGLSRERVWKSLKRLEEVNLVWRYRVDQRVYYVSYYWIDSVPMTADAAAQRVRFTNRGSSPDELKPVRQTNSINTKYKQQIKREVVEEIEQPIKLEDLMAQALAYQQKL
jgi:hypothetical protein